MGIIVSKDNQKRTKKVQQTAAVVSALKLASKESKGKDSPTASQTLATPTASHETKDNKLSLQDHDLEREQMPNLNYDKSSISYGLPELDPSDSLGYKSGTTGYWDKTDKAIVSIPYFGAWKHRVENEELCTICGVYTGVEVHPCRVCCKVFHELCLKKKGKLYDRTELEAFRKANTEKGWSCHDCESVTTLLTDEEMQQLIENFDKLDVNQDTQINEDEYVRYKTSQYKDIHNENMPAYMEEEARNEFKQMDKDQTGTIDWWEFLNHEALKIISANRSKFQLVRMLSPLEIQKARDIFHAFDKDEDGYINSYEVAMGFTRWFGNLRVFDQDQRSRSGSSSFGRALDPKDVSGHIDRHSRIFMDADTDRNRLVSWDEYLREQALYILAARPNN
ncbi:hypothetical protein ACROYT_G043904 [Oculina patagonica]